MSDCPDGGTCHHDCPFDAALGKRVPCARVRMASPLSIADWGDTWPPEVLAEHAPDRPVVVRRESTTYAAEFRTRQGKWVEWTGQPPDGVEDRDGAQDFVDYLRTQGSTARIVRVDSVTTSTRTPVEEV